MDSKVPAEIAEAAERRARARAARDWATADRLRAEIEGAGWRVVDAGTTYRLEPAHPPDVEVGGEVLYGRSDAVPSRLDAPPTGPATYVVVVEAGEARAPELLARIRAAAPPEVDVIAVADGLDDAAAAAIREAAPAAELVRTSEPLGRGAALNAGIRRASGRVVIVLDPSIEPEGDVVGPLVAALDDPRVAITGPLGLASGDLRHFEDVVASEAPADAAAIQGYLMAFRRADFVARGPMDEAFRFYRNLDIWWSLVLRDEGEGVPPRRAAVLPIPVGRGEPVAWSTTPAAARDRLSKRNFYRILNRFRDRLDLAVPPS